MRIGYTDQEIIDAYKRLGTQDKVRDELGISHTTVFRVLKRNNVKSDGRKYNGKNQETKITDAELIKACKTMTLNEIAEKYGMHPQSLPRRCKRLGVYPIKYREHARTGNPEVLPHRRVFGDCWHYIESQRNSFEKKHPGFEYVESKREPKKVRLKCRACGHIIERSSSVIRQNEIHCDNCENQRKTKEARADVVSVFIAIRNTKTPKICKICGGTFYSVYDTQKYCSKKCKAKAKNKTHSVRNRCRRYNVFYDPKVTSRKVFERDRYICKICGKPTDLTDKRWGTLGPNAPTIDHIIALKNGGTHTWDNVQCAHAICNSYKRDLWADEFEEVLAWMA